MFGIFSRLPVQVACVVVMWAMLYLVNAGGPELHGEEGSRALQARSMLEGGHWLVPELCGQRYILKPPLLPWLMAGAAFVTGALNEWAVRLPSLLATLATAFVVFLWVRHEATDGAGLFAAAAFLLMPVMFEKGSLGETDAIVMCCSFVAFAVWWGGVRAGRVAPWRWLAAGLVMGTGVMAKGPPALLFFVPAVLVLILRRRRYAELLGLLACAAIALAGVTAWALAAKSGGDVDAWRREMLQPRAFVLVDYLKNHAAAVAGAAAGTLPWIALAVLLFGRRPQDARTARGTGAALLVYCIAGSALLLLSPRVSARYLLPVVPAVAVAAGLVFGRLQDSAPKRVRLLTTIAAVIAVGRVVFLLAYVPYDAAHGSEVRRAARVLNAVTEDGPVYVLPGTGHNVVFYINRPCISVDAGELPRLTGGIVLLNERKSADAVDAVPGVLLQPLVRTEVSRKNALLAARVVAGEQPAHSQQ
ncbi:MAG TPA: glycosyltransferase family 39 protein [Planctomycetota bacterium]|nr:glycosyltransferase family 39 protein [Planctomycetota bacterium]